MMYNTKFTALLLLFLLACGRNKDEIIRQKVDVRVQDFTKKEKAKCREALLVKASAMVDSILLAEAQQELRDSLNRRRPFKPEQPPAVLPIDSLEIKPIFGSEKK